MHVRESACCHGFSSSGVLPRVAPHPGHPPTLPCSWGADATCLPPDIPHERCYTRHHALCVPGAHTAALWRVLVVYRERLDGCERDAHPAPGEKA
jgi:hypothetical protein